MKLKFSLYNLILTCNFNDALGIELQRPEDVQIVVDGQIGNGGSFNNWLVDAFN